MTECIKVYRATQCSAVFAVVQQDLDTKMVKMLSETNSVKADVDKHLSEMCCYSTYY